MQPTISLYLAALFLLQAAAISPPPAQRIVAVGDLHGDYPNTIEVLTMAGIVDKSEKWAGGDYTTFVQTGDVIDRGNDTIKLYALLERLRSEAEKAGGKVIPLLGNHELMNLSGDWRYVLPSEQATFGSLQDRIDAFKPTGFIGRYLFGLDLVAQVNTTVFCHGGVNPKFAAQGVDWINKETHTQLLEYHESEGRRGDPTGLFNGNGPTWYRDFALKPENEICPVLDEALKLLNATRMVVGHTLQSGGRIGSRCDGRVVLIDVGISAVYGRHRAALEIVGSVAKAIYPREMVEIKTRGLTWPTPTFVKQEL